MTENALPFGDRLRIGFLLEGYTSAEVTEIMSGNNSPIKERQERVKKGVNWILINVGNQDLAEIRKVLKDDFDVKCSYSLTYLSPKKFREKYFQNQNIIKIFENIFGFNIPGLDNPKDSYTVKNFNKNYNKLKTILGLPERAKSYYINKLKLLLKEKGVYCEFSLLKIGLYEIERQFKGNLIFKVCLKKLFGNPRVRDIGHKKMVEVLGLKKDSVSFYKELAFKELTNSFGIYQELVNKKSGSKNEYPEEIKLEIFNNIGARYYFFKVLKLKDISCVKNTDIDNLFTWSNFKESNIDIALSPKNFILKYLREYGIYSIEQGLGLSVKKFKKHFSKNSLFKEYFKNITGEHLCNSNFTIINNLYQKVFSDISD